MKKVLLSIAALGLFVLPAYATQGIREKSMQEIARVKKDNTIECTRKKDDGVIESKSAYSVKETQCTRKKDDGIIKLKSAYSVEETVQRFQSIAKEQGLNIVATVNHQAGAASVNQKLRPTQVIIFGNPAAGTPLMQCNQTAGIDLPQKALIWEDEQGQVWLGYNSPKFLSRRHQLKGCADEALERIGNALKMLAEKVTQ